ncbi:MAG: hypothetical protein RIB54_17660 [Fulvivirga sp.]|uniref:hypothetical protein n=1 Tax=Fulvivirga sp. TaxID=1931237 RepID=UPI0032F04679
MKSEKESDPGPKENQPALNFKLFTRVKNNNKEEYKSLLLLFIKDLDSFEESLLSNHSNSLSIFEKDAHKIQPILKHLQFTEFYNLIKKCFENRNKLSRDDEKKIIQFIDFTRKQVEVELRDLH